MDTLLIAIAVLPALILAYVVYKQDKVEKEPFKLLLKAFLYGCFSVIPAILLESALSLYTPGIPILRGLYDGYIVAGCSEELCKLMMLSLAVWKSREFNEYFDGIVYACYVSLGFACVENISYVFGAESYIDAMSTGMVRAVLSVPGHFLFGVMMGYYFSLAKFNPDKKKDYFFKAFWIPMMWHGTFDALLMVAEDLGDNMALTAGVLFFVFIIFDIRMWRWGVRRIRRLQELSKNQDNDRHNPFEGFKWYI
jgi:RsiW-degrading membrane proteinase PrsW (M82 family)